MAEQQIVEYIRKLQAIGVSRDAIKQDLLSAGWDSDKIDEAYQSINVPRPPVPKPPTPTPSRESRSTKRYTSIYSGLIAVVLVISLLILVQNAVTDILNHFAPSERGFSASQDYRDYVNERANLERQQPNRVNYENDEDYNVAYSNWYSQKYSNQGLYNQYLNKYKQKVPSPSFRLILHAGIVLPFWIITFILFLFLKENRRKYEAILGAYFVTSGWLLIFLFFNVASYVYNSNTAFGVYVVLGMIVIILTTAVWGIQKYRHSMS